jgi:hypothetical protein
VRDGETAQARGPLPYHGIEREAADKVQVGELHGLISGVADEFGADGAKFGSDGDRGSPGGSILHVLPDPPLLPAGRRVSRTIQRVLRGESESMLGPFVYAMPKYRRATLVRPQPPTRIDFLQAGSSYEVRRRSPMSPGLVVYDAFKGPFEVGAH